MRSPKRATLGECLRLVWLDCGDARLVRTKGTAAVELICIVLCSALLYLCISAVEYADGLRAAVAVALAVLLSMAAAALLGGAACFAFGLYRICDAPRYLPDSHEHALVRNLFCIIEGDSNRGNTAQILCPVCDAPVLVRWDGRMYALCYVVAGLLLSASAGLDALSRAWLSSPGSVRISTIALLMHLAFFLWALSKMRWRVAVCLGWYSIVRENPEWEG